MMTVWCNNWLLNGGQCVTILIEIVEAFFDNFVLKKIE